MLDQKDQAELVMRLAREGICPALSRADRLIAASLALRDRDPCFTLVMRDFKGAFPFRSGMSVLAADLLGNPVDIDGNWGWDAIFESYTAHALPGEKKEDWNAGQQCHISGDDWFDLVGYSEPNIANIKEAARNLGTALQAEVDRAHLNEKTPHSRPYSKASRF